jgi:hypothetical protein
MECKTYVQCRFVYGRCKRNIKTWVTFNVRAEGLMGEVAPNQQANIHSSLERGIRIMNWVQVFSRIRESYQQLRG